MAKKKSAEMLGPLYTKPGKSLGGADVSKLPEKSVPDPLGYNRT